LNDEISRQLREAAEAHQPDRGRMLARMERGMAGAGVRRRKPGIARSWPRVTFAGTAAACVLATAGLTVAGIVQTAPALPDNVTTPTVPSPSGTPSSTPSARTTGSAAAPSAPGQPDLTTARRSTSGKPNSASPPAGQVSDGPLSSEGSIDPHSHIYWTQSRLTLNTTQPLTALTVELHIAQTGGVQTTGQWQTGPGHDFAITVQETGGTLVYRWELKPGRTVPAGQHFFAAQFNHSTGRRAADNYNALATAADGAHTVRGGFTQAR
jgi:hypothetical protein